ncbi:toprim domain-containing protein [Nocardia suismassiliense]|uniref:toprim domain-containing protein n=1 Tax=Nocardia suismassiliense TaxID=2077092 RepID=UPI000D1F68F9|nr:toprim domain-containing protein [Nocardia suismassiliense]
MEPQQAQGRSWQIITTALDRTMGTGKGSQSGWVRYLCPVHEADGHHHNPSLGVRYDPSQSKTIVRCFAGCDDRDVLARLDLRVRDMFDRLPERDPNRRSPRTQPRTTTSEQQLAPVERAIQAARFPIPARRDLGTQTGPAANVDTYVYRWPDGRVEGAVTRVHTPHEYGYAKSFWQARWTGTAWEPGGFAPIPWRLNHIREALDTGREIFVCEGEKDVQRANQAGLIATCNAMGAGSWKPEHARWLVGAGRVIVVADRDCPGYRHAAKVADTLAGRVGEVRVLQARSGKDLADHFDAGYQLEDLTPVPYLDRPQQPRFRPAGRTRSR